MMTMIKAQGLRKKEIRYRFGKLTGKNNIKLGEMRSLEVQKGLESGVMSGATLWPVALTKNLWRDAWIEMAQ